MQQYLIAGTTHGSSNIGLLGAARNVSGTDGLLWWFLYFGWTKDENKPLYARLRPDTFSCLSSHPHVHPSVRLDWRVRLIELAKNWTHIPNCARGRRYNAVASPVLAIHTANRHCRGQVACGRWWADSNCSPRNQSDVSGLSCPRQHPFPSRPF